MTKILSNLLLNNLLILCLLKRCHAKVEVNGTILKCGSPTLMLDEAPELRHVVMNCHRKIRLSITLYNTKMPPKNVEFLRIDIIYDPELRTMVRLSNPIVVMMKREPLILAYPFYYATAVNAKVKEIVLNKRNRMNYTGCDDMSPAHATCGIKTERGRIVPFSKGFCCSCRDTSEAKTHPRGGQDCTKKTSEEEQDMYLTSAHCLHFDDIWYLVCNMDPPTIKHDVHLQVFARHEKRDESFIWVDMTKNQSFTVGTDNPFQYNDLKSMVATYITEDPQDSAITLDYKRQFLLVPEMTPTMDFNTLPAAVKNGASDFLVLPKEFVRVDGTQCDKAGVSYEAFYKQKDRCHVPANSCLKNQPFDLWEEDNKKRLANTNGSHLLSFYGSVYEDPILFNRTTKEHWLAFEHQSPHVSVIYIEMDASSIVALRMGKYARLTQLATISSDTDSKLLVSITNIGLVPSRFSVKAVRCDEQIADSTDKSLLVPPQHTVVYDLFISFKSMQPDGTFTCIDVISSTCRTMDEESFHLAGFKGSLPVLHRRDETELISLYTLFFLLIILVSFGFIKAFLGLYYNKEFEEFGLTPIIFQRKILKNYVEPDLKQVPIEYDEEAYPVYPGTEERARVISRGKIFYLNIVFFLIFPFLLLLALFRRCKKESFEYTPISADDEFLQKADDTIQEPFVQQETTTRASKPEQISHYPSTSNSFKQPVQSKHSLTKNKESVDQVYPLANNVIQSTEAEYPSEMNTTRQSAESVHTSTIAAEYPLQHARKSNTTASTETSHSKQRQNEDMSSKDTNNENNIHGKKDSATARIRVSDHPNVQDTSSTTGQMSQSTSSKKESEYTDDRQINGASKDTEEEISDYKQSISTGTYTSSDDDTSDLDDTTDTSESETTEDEVHVKIAVDTEGAK